MSMILYTTVTCAHVIKLCNMAMRQTCIACILFFTAYFLQESIEQAKKSWELSHLQSLREEEERIAEEDVDDEMLLTYDRPELANKVILRRHSSTGMWEVCSPNKISQKGRRTENSSISTGDSVYDQVSTHEQITQEPVSVSSLSKERHTGSTAVLEEDCAKPSSYEQPMTLRSPRSIHVRNQEMLVEQETSKDVDFVMKLGHLSNVGVSTKLKHIERELKSPRICLSPAIPCTYRFPRSQSSSDIEQIECKPESDDCIGSRTRQRVTAQVPSNNHIHSNSQTLVHSNENSPAITHKYPTRHKMTGLS